MSSNQRLFESKLLNGITAGLLLALSGSVMVGWHTHNIRRKDLA